MDTPSQDQQLSAATPNEVSLEKPPSPRKTLVLLGIIGIIFLFVLGAAYLLGTNTVGSSPQSFEGKNFTFTYPTGWKPTEQVLCCGAIWESVKLGIPGNVTDQSMSYSAVALSALKNQYQTPGQSITIGGNTGMKWIRKSANSVSYDYYTTGMDGKGSFGIHVSVPTENKSLESQLDSVMSSLSFK